MVVAWQRRDPFDGRHVKLTTTNLRIQRTGTVLFRMKLTVWKCRIRLENILCRDSCTVLLTELGKNPATGTEFRGVTMCAALQWISLTIPKLSSSGFRNFRIPWSCPPSGLMYLNWKPYRGMHEWLPQAAGGYARSEATIWPIVCLACPDDQGQGGCAIGAPC